MFTNGVNLCHVLSLYDVTTGFLHDVTGDYAMAFYVAGAAIAASGLICLPIRMVAQCTTTGHTVIETDVNIDNIQHSPETEKALMSKT